MNIKEFKKTFETVVLDALEKADAEILDNGRISIRFNDLASCDIPMDADVYEYTLGYLDDIISLNDDVESMDRRDKEIAELKEKLQNRNEAICKLREQIDGLKKAVDILINTKSEDKTPEGIRLSVSDFSDVYEAMFCNGDYMTEDGWNNDEGLDLKEEHLYGHDVHLAWHGLWCNLQDGASVYNYIMCNLPELAEEVDD